MSGRRFAVHIAIVAAVACVGRVLYLITVTRHDWSIDQYYFYESATQLADGRWFQAPPIFGSGESAEHPPLTMLALAPVAWVTDNNDFAMRMLVALAGVATLVVIALIAREVAGWRAGLTAACVAAVYPNLWMNDGLFMSETFATLFTATAVLACYRLWRGHRWPWAAIGGGACALAMLTRGELALLVPLLLVPVILRGPDPGRRRLAIGAVALGTCALLVAPWVVYNLVRFERPVLLSHGDGGVLAGANCELTYGGSDLGSWHGFCLRNSTRNRGAGAARGRGDRSVANEVARRAGLDYMAAHLRQLPLVVTARVGRQWSFFDVFQMARLAEGEGKPRWASWAGLGAYWALFGCAIAGVMTLWRRRERLWPLLAPLLLVTVTAAMFYGLVRFRAPAEASIVVLAAVAIAAFADRFPALRTRGG